MLRPGLRKASLFAVLACSAGCLPPADESTINKSPAVSDETTQTAESEAASAPAAQPAGPSGTEGFTTTGSGLKYKIIKPGSGKKPRAIDSVLAHYKGTLTDGTVFDSSYERGEPLEFPLGGVIGGWTEGLQLIGEGGEIELIIPPELGYGARGAGRDIPPNATLHFRIELVEVR